MKSAPGAEIAQVGNLQRRRAEGQGTQAVEQGVAGKIHGDIDAVGGDQRRQARSDSRATSRKVSASVSARRRGAIFPRAGVIDEDFEALPVVQTEEA